MLVYNYSQLPSKSNISKTTFYQARPRNKLRYSPKSNRRQGFVWSNPLANVGSNWVLQVLGLVLIVLTIFLLGQVLNQGSRVDTQAAQASAISSETQNTNVLVNFGASHNQQKLTAAADATNQLEELK